MEWNGLSSLFFLTTFEIYHLFQLLHWLIITEQQEKDAYQTHG